MPQYELRCRECGKSWGNQPRSICDDCFSPLEVSYDYDALRSQVRREAGAHSWELRSGKPPLLANCRRTSVGIRERESSPVLRGRFEDGRLRNCRAAWLETAR